MMKHVSRMISMLATFMIFFSSYQIVLADKQVARKLDDSRHVANSCVGELDSSTTSSNIEKTKNCTQDLQRIGKMVHAPFANSVLLYLMASMLLLGLSGYINKKMLRRDRVGDG